MSDLPTRGELMLNVTIMKQSAKIWIFDLDNLINSDITTNYRATKFENVHKWEKYLKFYNLPSA